MIINVSVWEDIFTFEKFIHKSFYTEFLKRQKEWFLNYGKVFTAMWWILKGQYPTIEQAVAKLALLRENGPTETVFDFKNKFNSPIL